MTVVNIDMFDIHVQTRETLLSDHHKDAYGFRPSLRRYPKWITIRELDAEHERLDKIMTENDERQKFREAVALELYVSYLEEVQRNHGVSEADTIRWDMQSEGYEHHHQQSLEHFFWKKGLSFEQIDKWTKKTMELLGLPKWSDEWL